MKGDIQMSEQLGRRELRAVLSQLIGTMRDEHSWTGHTQIQKSCLFLQNLLGVPLGYEFELYLHGPYSFELRDDLDLMIELDELDLEPRPGYGPSFSVTDRGKKIVDHATGFLSEIEFVAKEVAQKDVRQLEQISTAYFLMIQDNGLSEEQIPAEVNRLKPHISEDVARSALGEVLALKMRATEFLRASAV